MPWELSCLLPLIKCEGPFEIDVYLKSPCVEFLCDYTEMIFHSAYVTSNNNCKNLCFIIVNEVNSPASVKFVLQ